MVETPDPPKTIFEEFKLAKELCHAIEETLHSIDIPDNRMQLATMHEEAREACRILGEKCRELSEEIMEEKKVQKGSFVKVMGSSSPKDAKVGLVGKVIWTGVTRFGKERVGILAVDDYSREHITVWASLHNVEVDL